MTIVLAYLKDPERSAMAFERLAHDYPGVTVHAASSLAEAGDAVPKAQVLITIGGHIGADAAAVYAAANQLCWVQSFGTGTDNIKGHPALDQGVAVTNVHGVHGPQLSEAAFAAMLGFARHVPQTLRNQDAAVWQKLPASLLHGKTAGIFGLGAIASDLAPRCKAFGMRVVGISAAARELPGFDAVYARSDLKRAVATLDYLILLTPYSPDTHHIIGADVFAAMKPGAVLINLARGGVVDEQALLAALDTGQIAGAALDVFASEPLDPQSPFWSHPKVSVTPHAAGFHTGYPGQAYAVVADNLGRFLRGGIAALRNRV